MPQWVRRRFPPDFQADQPCVFGSHPYAFGIGRLDRIWLTMRFGGLLGMRSSNRFLRFATALLLALALSAHAGDKPKKMKYVAPDGFNGHLWGELLTGANFAQVPLKAIGVGAAWMQPLQKRLDFTCVP